MHLLALRVCTYSMMFYRALQVYYFHFFTIFCCVNSETLMKTNEKRISMRNNYKMCPDRFDIHRDKIIRTHESRDMGAKYLNEDEFDSKEECLKFCCDTDDCDVFVFEEKVHVFLYASLLYRAHAHTHNVHLFLKY